MNPAWNTSNKECLFPEIGPEGMYLNKKQKAAEAGRYASGPGGFCKVRKIKREDWYEGNML